MHTQKKLQQGIALDSPQPGLADAQGRLTRLTLAGGGAGCHALRQSTGRSRGSARCLQCSDSGLVIRVAWCVVSCVLGGWLGCKHKRVHPGAAQAAYTSRQGCKAPEGNKTLPASPLCTLQALSVTAELAHATARKQACTATWLEAVKTVGRYNACWKVHSQTCGASQQRCRLPRAVKLLWMTRCMLASGRPVTRALSLAK